VSSSCGTPPPAKSRDATKTPGLKIQDASQFFHPSSTFQIEAEFRRKIRIASKLDAGQIGLRANLAASQFESGVVFCGREDRRAKSFTVSKSAFDDWKLGEK
jgi:hypothetical protein